MNLASGTRLGPYEIVAPIGAGGMGEVYRARDTRLGRTVAVKILPSEFGTDAKLKIRFEREARAISALNHPHICTLHDVGDSYFVMEYCEGESLSNRIARAPLPLEEVLRYGIEIADALEAAHRHGIVHRDLKPSNIMLTSTGVKLLDFGLARHSISASTDVTTAAEVSEDGKILGTIHYMAPEVLRGGTADERSDIFALGLTLYEMVRGRRAFDGTSRADVIAAILEREPPPLPGTAPPALDKIIRACLAKDPSRRMQTATEVRLQLHSIAAGPSWRRVNFKPAAIALAAIVVIAGGWYGWQQTRTAAGAPIRSLVVLPLANLSGPDQEYFAAGMHDAVIGQLARIGELRVISRTSALHYAGGRKPVPEIARELGVDAVVEGSVLRSGDSVRIQVELIQARPQERQMWSETFDRNLRDVLSLQSDVARSIADAIKVRLTQPEAARLRQSRKVEPETYDAYLKGMYYVNRLTPDDVAKGISFLTDAVRKDPGDPFANAALATAYITAGHGPDTTPEMFTHAKALAQRALQADDDIAEAHMALAGIALYRDLDWDAGERELRRALDLNPSLPDAHRHYGFYRQLMGHPEDGIRELIRAKELDPLSPLYRAELGWHYWCAGQLEKAYEEARGALDLDPNFAMGGTFFTQIAADMGKYDEAISQGRKSWKFGLAYAYAKAGRRDEARAIAAGLAKNPQPILGWGLASVYVALDEREEAMRWIEYGVNTRFTWMPWIGRDRALRALREDPRFQEFQRRMKVPR